MERQPRFVLLGVTCVRWPFFLHIIHVFEHALYTLYRLTEKMISDPSDEGALAVQDLTFARLCPLLILLVRSYTI